MNNRLPIVLTLLWVWGMPFFVFCQSSYNIYFGDIHSHTWYSDGNKDQDTNTYKQPVARALTYARDNSSNLDFLGISEHNHNESLHMKLGYWRAGNAEADSLNQDGTFVGLFGQEWGVISGGGHVLVYGTNKLFGWNPGVYDIYVPKSNYNLLFDSVKKENGFCYLAHPQQTDFSGIFTNTYNAAWDSVVQGCAIKNGPAFSTNTAETDPAGGDYVSRYHDLLRLGYHVAPCANQDNHYTNFGRSNQQRTAVLAQSLTRVDIVDALRNRRAYATEDHNIKIYFEAGTHEMGEIFSMTGSIPFHVKVIDPDGGDHISRMELRFGIPGSGTAPTALTTVLNQDSLVYSQAQPMNSTYYYYVYVQESDGQRAWTAPVWITISPSSGLGSFQLVTPTNNAISQPPGGTLTWQSSVNATGYDVYLDTNFTPITIVSSNQATTSFSYNGLQSGTTYYWKVVSKNGSESLTATGAPWSFSTVTANPLGLFNLLTPSNGAVNQPLNGTLTWDASTNASVYDVFIDQQNPPAVIVNANQTDTTFSYSGLAGDTTYYWKVVAKNGTDSIVASGAPWSFTTAVAPAAPTGIVSNNITTGSVHLQWDDNAANETGYRIYRSDASDSPYVQIGGDYPPNTISFTDTGLNINQRYYYRIAPFNNVGEGTFGFLNVATLAVSPGAPTISNVHYQTMTFIIEPGLNPPQTQFAIEVRLDTVIQFVQLDGKLGASPLWQTFAEWGDAGGMSINGLKSCKEYSIRVKARNLADVETSFSTGVHQTLSCFSITNPVSIGWNLVSLPAIVADNHSSSVFPPSSSKVFRFQGGYVSQDTLTNGSGYWLKFKGNDTVIFSGEPRFYDTIAVKKGWNIIGSISLPVNVGSIVEEPNGIVATPYYGYNGAYTAADSIFPMKGYWIKAGADGKLILSSFFGIPKSAAKHFSRTMFEGLNSLTFKDGVGHCQTLYIGTEGNVEDELSKFELPPVPPTGAFDVRFSTGRMTATPDELKFLPVFISSTCYPVKVQWEMKERNVQTSLVIDGKEIKIIGSGATEISYPTFQIYLSFSPAVPGFPPGEFALDQNFPNPFNPSTVIKYQLPIDSRIKLSIYNVLGQEVKYILDEAQQAGYKSIEWNSTSNSGITVTSGIYFYRLEATGILDQQKSFIQVRKMILVK